MAGMAATEQPPAGSSTKKGHHTARVVNTRHEETAVQLPKAAGYEELCASAPIQAPATPTPVMSVEEFTIIAEAVLAAGSPAEHLQEAEASAGALRDAIVTSVNNRATNVKDLQETAVSMGVLLPLVSLARCRSVVAFEALQILSYRNRVCVQQLVNSGMLQLVESILLEGDDGDVDLQAAAMFLLAALVAFNEDCHPQVIMSKMLPRLVQLCRAATHVAVQHNNRLGSLQSRASVVLRNLAHSEQCHAQLLASGAAEALAAVMQRESETCNRWMRKLEAQGITFSHLLNQPDSQIQAVKAEGANSSLGSSDEGTKSTSRRIFARQATMQLGGNSFGSFSRDSFKEDRAARQNAWIEELRSHMKQNLAPGARPESVASTSSTSSNGLYPSIRGGKASPNNRVSGSSFGDVEEHLLHRPDRTSISGAGAHGLPHLEPPSPASTRFSLSFLGQPINPSARQSYPQHSQHVQQRAVTDSHHHSGQQVADVRHSLPAPGRALNSRSSVTSHENTFDKHATIPPKIPPTTRRRPNVSPGRKGKPPPAAPPQQLEVEVSTKSAMRARFSDVPGTRKAKQVSIALPSAKSSEKSDEEEYEESSDEEGGAFSDTSRAASITSRFFYAKKKRNNKTPTMDEVKESFARRINATMAVAILVGHEENNPWLQMDEFITQDILAALDRASRGEMHHGYFWTVWKLCQALANLTVNDTNKELIVKVGGVEVLAKVMQSENHKNELSQRYAISALWNLAFIPEGRKRVQSTPKLVEAIRQLLHETPDTRTRELAKGCLWTLGCTEDFSTQHLAPIAVPVEQTALPTVHQPQAPEAQFSGNLPQPQHIDQMPQHIMISYEWGSQAKVLLIKEELEKAGYHTWMDVDKMSGSTLEAMALAVEGAAAVLCCVSKKYKESQACRTEAEYAFQMRKRIVPVLMETNYKPTGWLGALLGTKLYFDMSDRRLIPERVTKLCRELGDAGKLHGFAGMESIESGAASSEHMLPPLVKNGGVMETRASISVDSWSEKDVQDWLDSCSLKSLAPVFEQHGINGLALNGLHRLADKSCIRKIIRDDLGVTNTRDMLLLVEQLYRLF